MLDHFTFVGYIDSLINKFNELLLY